MRTMILLALCLSMASLVVAEVRPRVCFGDPNTPAPPIDPNYPHMYPDIMVGTKLIIIIDSNVAEYWSGCLIIEDANMDYGVLSARGPLLFGDWSGSHLEAAGDYALVNYNYREDPNIDEFSLYTDWELTVEAGDWFIIDYNATNIGECNVGFYEYDPPDGNDILINYLEFTHVPSRDFDRSTIVDFGDFAVFASYWLVSSCTAPKWCDGTDLDRDHDVDGYDLALFGDYWHERTE